MKSNVNLSAPITSHHRSSDHSNGQHGQSHRDRSAPIHCPPEIRSKLNNDPNDSSLDSILEILRRATLVKKVQKEERIAKEEALRLQQVRQQKEVTIEQIDEHLPADLTTTDLNEFEENLNYGISLHLLHLGLTEGPLFPNTVLQWKRLKFKENGPTARSGHVAELVDEKMIIFGGYCEQTHLTDHIFIVNTSLVLSFGVSY